MRRHEFLSLLPGMTGLGKISLEETNAASIVPPSLKKGDKIAFTSPAGFITLEEVQPAKQLIESWGFKVRMGNTIGKRDYTFGGTDEERLMDLQLLLDDNTVKAIMCARGGYGVGRILDKLNFSRFREKPKWIIGFSDITALHLHIQKLCGVASIHSKMCNSFPKDWNTAEPIVKETILSIKDALEGEALRYVAPTDMYNRMGEATGQLTGGNLSIIISMMGTKSEINTDGKILFLEEVGEYLYSLDRMMTTLKRAGKLSKLKGLVIGGFNRIKTDDPGEEFGHTIQDIILSKLKEFNYPVCFSFPVGHQKDNYALKYGVAHKLVVNKDGSSLVGYR